MNTNRTEKVFWTVFVVLSVYIISSVALGISFGAKNVTDYVGAFAFTGLCYGAAGVLWWKFRDEL